MPRHRSSFDPSAPEKANNQIRTLLTLLPYLWPKGRLGLRARVLGALGFLAGAKLLSVYAPFLFGDALDRLAPEAGAAIAVPVALVVAYAGSRVLMTTFAELRDLVFARVGQNAIREIALQTFRHLHRLALRFHLARQVRHCVRGNHRGFRGPASSSAGPGASSSC